MSTDQAGSVAQGSGAAAAQPPADGAGLDWPELAGRSCGLGRAAPDGMPADGAGDQAQHFRSLLDALPAAVYTTDVAGRLTFYNRAAVALWGRAPPLGTAQWCGSWRLFWPDGTPMPHEECPMAVALRERRPVRGAEAIAERPDGVRVPFIPYPTPLYDAAGTMIGAVNMLVDISERKQTERRLALLAREVDHRAKNMLAVIQAMVRTSRADTAEAFSANLQGRLRALANAQSLLAATSWRGADLAGLVAGEFAPYAGGDGRLRMAGPRVTVAAPAVQPLSIVVHELATNAAKYGALAAAGGAIDVRWSRRPEGGVALGWTETGGPASAPPSRTGFGLALIEMTIRDQLGGGIAFDWRRAGLACTITLPADALAESG